jgi:hypothetical protein
MNEKRRKVRWSTWLEVSLLGLGCAGLAYFSCRDESARPSRESKVFSAPRSESESAASGSADGTRRAIEVLLGNVLTGVAAGEVSEERRVDLQRELMRLLEQSGTGRPETRANAAGMIVQQIFDRAKLQTASPQLSLRQRQAILAMGRELTRQLLLLAVGASPGADAIGTALPEGYTRIDWKRIGGFTYLEGGELPEDVRALDGRAVGVPGFILTMGDTEGLREFILLESLWGCCFGSVPDVNQTILVRLGPARAMDYTAAPVLVTGKMQVGEERQAGFVASLYRIVDATVTPLDGASRN